MARTVPDKPPGYFLFSALNEVMYHRVHLMNIALALADRVTARR
jgi:hypothetical protein